MSVILVVTIGQGGQARILNEMESFGTNLFAIFIGTVEDDYDQYRFTLEDCRAIRESVDGIKALVPVAYGFTTVENSRKKESATVYGTDADYAEVRNVTMAEGRFFSSIDNAVGRRVMVINQKMAEDMFGSSRDAVGQKLKIRQMSVVVCGVSELFGNVWSERPTVYMPIKLIFDCLIVKKLSMSYTVPLSTKIWWKSPQKSHQILQVRHNARY